MAKTATAQKEVTILARISVKADPRKVVYQVLASNGTDKYEVHMFDGKACYCSCPSTRGCYHRSGCEAREAARQPESDETPGLDAAEQRIASLRKQVAEWKETAQFGGQAHKMEQAPSGRLVPMR